MINPCETCQSGEALCRYAANMQTVATELTDQTNTSWDVAQELGLSDAERASTASTPEVVAGYEAILDVVPLQMRVAPEAADTVTRILTEANSIVCGDHPGFDCPKGAYAAIGLGSYFTAIFAEVTQELPANSP